MVHEFFLALFSIGEAVLAVYGVMFLIEMDWAATKSLWFKFSMVTIEIALMWHLLLWILLSTICILACCGVMKVDGHATVNKIGGRKHHSSAVHQNVDVEVELSEEQAEFEDYDHAQNGYRH